MGTAGFGGSFSPIVQYEKWEIHPVFPHFHTFTCVKTLPESPCPLMRYCLNKMCGGMSMRILQSGTHGSLPGTAVSGQDLPFGFA